jgi:hypothetical protein
MKIPDYGSTQKIHPVYGILHSSREMTVRLMLVAGTWLRLTVM